MVKDMSGSRQCSINSYDKRSSFAQTCNLLSQYIQRRGRLRGLNREIGGKIKTIESIARPSSCNSASTTKTRDESVNKGKSVVPSREERASSVHSADQEFTDKTSPRISTKRKVRKSQLTIFYGGRVLVFDDFQIEKVSELVALAKRGSSQMSYGISSNTYLAMKFNPRNGISASSNSTSSPSSLPPRPHQARNSHNIISISSNTSEYKKTSPN